MFNQGEKRMTGYIQGLIDEVEELNKIKDKYNKLIFAVESKFTGETRHETALRYITERENNTTTIHTYLSSDVGYCAEINGKPVIEGCNSHEEAQWEAKKILDNGSKTEDTLKTCARGIEL